MPCDTKGRSRSSSGKKVVLHNCDGKIPPRRGYRRGEEARIRSLSPRMRSPAQRTCKSGGRRSKSGGRRSRSPARSGGRRGPAPPQLPETLELVVLRLVPLSSQEPANQLEPATTGLNPYSSGPIGLRFLVTCFYAVKT